MAWHGSTDLHAAQSTSLAGPEAIGDGPVQGLVRTVSTAHSPTRLGRSGIQCASIFDQMHAPYGPGTRHCVRGLAGPEWVLEWVGGDPATAMLTMIMLTMLDQMGLLGWQAGK